MLKEVLITNESIKRLTKVTGLNSLCEAIWNSIDAESTIINISTNIDPHTKKLKTITIDDNGEGINYHKFDECFTLFQKSWKKNNKRKNNKLFHGRNGEGRFKLFSIAEKVTWETVYRNNENTLNQYKITCNSSKPKSFYIEEESKAIKQSSGTLVILENLLEKGQSLNNEHLYYDLVSIYALYLEADINLSINLNGQKLDPSKFIKKDTKGLFDISLKDQTTGKEEKIEIKYRFIAWTDDFKYNDKKHVYFFDNHHNYILEKPSGVQGNIIPHSVFLMSDYFENFDGLFEEYDNKIQKIKSGYHKLLIEFLFAVRREHSKDEFDKFLTTKYYPFDDKSLNNIEIAQKELFDICAFKILETDSKILSKKENSLNLLFKLLKKVIEKDDNISAILTEILDLTENESKTFKNIIDSTSLPKLISHYDEIKRKLTFLDVLDTLVYDGFYKKNLKERTQLHKIVERETWIFGEEFSENLGTSDQSLDRVIKENFKISGDITSTEYAELENNLRNAKKDDKETLLKKIPDLYLWNDFQTNNGKIINNLIVELKAPSVKIKQKEIDQINVYRRGISSNKSNKVSNENLWTYYVISSEIDEDDIFKDEFEDYEKGLLFNKNGMKVLTKTWDNIIKSSRQSLNRQKKDLEIKISEEEKKNLLNKYLKEVGF